MMLRDMSREERRAHEQIEDRWLPRANLASAASPFAILAPIWHDLRQIAGLEGAALVAVILQIALIVTLPPQMARWIADRAIIRARRTKH